jgi:hypothetical protein
MEAFVEGLTIDRGTLTTVVIDGRIGSAVEGFDSFADSAFSFSSFILFEKGMWSFFFRTEQEKESQ